MKAFKDLLEQLEVTPDCTVPCFGYLALVVIAIERSALRPNWSVWLGWDNPMGWIATTDATTNTYIFMPGCCTKVCYN